MGSVFECRCNECEHEFRVVQGGGFSFVYVCCDGCGDTKSLPRFAPRLRPKSDLTDALRKTADRLKFFSSTGLETDKSFEMSEVELISYFEQRQWVKRGDVWRQNEWQILLSLLGACPCGGRWVEPQITSGSTLHSLHRCPKCRSRSFKYQYPDIVFD